MPKALSIATFNLLNLALPGQITHTRSKPIDDKTYASKKRWIAGQLEPKGTIHIDSGAESALFAGKSLLPAGVRRVEGAFERGDAVTIRGADGRDLGRGVVAYSHDDAIQIVGKQSAEIAAILGHEGRAELIHRDDMALNRK